MAGRQTNAATASRYDKLRTAIGIIQPLTGDSESASASDDSFTNLEEKFWQVVAENSNMGRRPVLVTAYAATITPDVSLYGTYEIGALTGNIAINNPTGITPVDGQQLSIRLLQDGTGGRTITWDTQYQFGSTFASGGITTLANQSFHVLFEWVASASKWRCLSIVRQA